ncbi:hypothetical protein FLONG3_3163 [Fusarium longipes]|uniref:Uncharacterized protein n=1 Tax=Fusarium longipes TaxID=694270 RepID=A0A395T1X4_9HYPO|nr:hypothetical protein FLONG3_3163 [Fusarium longipes]
MTDWRQIPPPRREIFNLDDIVNQTNHFLNVAVRTGLISFALQVYQIPGEDTSRYHFYFHLNESIQFRDTSGDVASIHGLAMWMECQEPLKGELTVRFVIKHRPFFRALASFEFPIKNAWRPYDANVILLDIINVLRGTAMEVPDHDRVNLTQFRFWPMGTVNRGYRDALTQWMVRLNNNEYVGWWCFEQSVKDTVIEASSDDELLSSHMFGSIIGSEYTTENHYDNDFFLVVNMKRKPIRRGVWMHMSYERILRHHGTALPYEGPLAWAEIENETNTETTGHVATTA